MPAKRSVCLNGHARTPENLFTSGACKLCRKDNQAIDKERSTRVGKGKWNKPDFERVDCSACKGENCNRCDWSGYHLVRKDNRKK